MTTKSGEGGTQHQSGGTRTNNYDIVLRLLDGFMVRRIVVDICM